MKDLKIAWYLGDQRKTSYEVEISDDGKTWTTVYSGASRGNGTEPESAVNGGFAAKFVRITCSGTTA